MYSSFMSMHFELIAQSSLGSSLSSHLALLHLFCLPVETFSCEMLKWRSALKQFNECFQVFITSLNLTKIKNGFNYFFALITTKCTQLAGSELK